MMPQTDHETTKYDGEQLLLGAIQNECNNEILSDLINHGCNINTQTREGNTPLHYAVKRDTIDITCLLLRMGADVNARNINGYTPLHVTAKFASIGMLQEVLRIQHIKVDEKNESGETPLYLSLLENRSDQIVSTLIDAGCSVNLTNGWKKETPLHLAVLRQTDTISFKLIERGADMNAQDYRDGLTPLHVAVRKCSDDLFVSRLINLASDVNIQDYINYTPLHYAAYRESIFIARKLIEKGSNVDFINFEGDTFLHHAVHVSNFEYLCMLLYYGTPTNEINQDGRTPFFMSVCFYGFDDNIHGKDIVQYLINYVTDINQEDEDGITVLHITLLYNYDIALDILENGGDVNKLFKGMHTLYSAWTGHTSYDVLRIIWEKTDFKIFLTSLVRGKDNGKSFLKIYCEHCLLPTDQFVKYLLMMFESPYIEDIVEPRSPEIDECIIRSVVRDRDLTLDQRVEVFSLFLSFGVTVHFRDVCALYHKHGFDESLEVILMSGCFIHPGVTDIRRISPLIYRICYDAKNTLWSYDYARNLSECGFLYERPINQELIDLDVYYEYYRTTFLTRHDMFVFCHNFSSTKEIPSLLEMSRDAVRKWIYKRYCTFRSFNVYYAMSKLPVPTLVRDILYLKRPIYKRIENKINC